MRRLFLALVIVVASVPASARIPSLPQQTPDQMLDRAVELSRRGKLDQAVLLLNDAADLALRQNNPGLAAKIELLLGQLYRDLGQDENYLNTVLKAIGHAKGTPLETLASVELILGTAEINLQQKYFLPTLEFLFSAQEEIPKIGPQGDRESRQSQALTLWVNLYGAVAEVMGDQLDGASARELPPPLQIFLVSALQKVPPKKFDENPTSRKVNLPPEHLSWLDQHRPWRKNLLRAAIEINEQVTILDQGRKILLNGVDVAPLEVAKDISQRADLYEALGDIDKALELKAETLKTFDKFNIFDDGAQVLDALVRLRIAKGGGEELIEALRASSELIYRIEQQSTALVGQTVIQFLERFRPSYVRHFYLLLAQHRALKTSSDPNTNRALDVFLLHADRLNFRPTRRDLSVYRELGDRIGSNPEVLRRFNAQKQKVIEQRQLRDRAVSEGKKPEDFCPTPRLCINSPFLELDVAKKDIVSVLEDFKRQQVGNANGYGLPQSMDEVRQGMTTSDAIVMYIEVRESNQLMAAVLTSDGPSRLVELPSITIEQVKQIAKQLNNQIVAVSPKAQDILKQLAQAIWEPLSTLPENLTIVLTPNLIGVPFESLPEASGSPVIAQHKVRYCFGLARSIGAGGKAEGYQKAMVIGAERFFTRNLPLLTSSRQEVERLQTMLRNRAIAVTPVNGLPEMGRPFFSKGDSFDLIHVSTHSALDLDVPSVPMTDALVFPRDELFAYDLALSPLRAKLLVLSACELFRGREDRFNPVSGVTTAAMARIAPQVISTLWSVDAEATRVFMLRFYDRLIKERDPSAALAATKRDFLNPSQLESWIKSNKMMVPANINSYKEPYYWAPFVLTVGIP